MWTEKETRFGPRQKISRDAALFEPEACWTDALVLFLDDTWWYHWSTSKQTNLYAKRDRNKMDFSISKEEMMNFIGLIFLSGYNIRKSIQDYWSVDPDLGCSSFRETMSRNRFEEIKSVFHIADNAFLGLDSRMLKVKPIYDMINEKIA